MKNNIFQIKIFLPLIVIILIIGFVQADILTGEVLKKTFETASQRALDSGTGLFSNLPAMAAAHQAATVAALEAGVPFGVSVLAFPIDISPSAGPLDKLDIDAGTVMFYWDGVFNVDDANEIVTDSGAKMKGAKDVYVTDDGRYMASNIATLQDRGVTVINGVNVVFENDIIRADHADSIIRDGSVTTNVDNLNISLSDNSREFSVERADKIIADCITVDNVANTVFAVSPGHIDMWPSPGVTLNIEDCSFASVSFKASGNNSKISVDKEGNYNMTNGTLNCYNDVNETLVANNSASATIDANHCFECMTMEPIGTYFYNDEDIRKDFAIHVPVESSSYKLCIRKNQGQWYRDYNGLVDFVDKKIELSGIADYLRYQLLYNQPISLLLGNLYQGKTDVRTVLAHDQNMFFIGDTSIILDEPKPLVAVTYPNDYYTINETDIGGETHRLVRLDHNLSYTTENLVFNYKTNYFDADITITENVLVQNNIAILPVYHTKIDELLK